MIRNILLILVATAVVFFGFEYAVTYVDRDSQSDPMDRRASADAYHNAGWVDDYFAELWAGEVEWEPYTYWRYKRRNGDFINIDENGLRHTVQGGNGQSSEASKRIFMFGGSTLFGTGARDAYTIPSLISAELFRKGINAEVVNYGQSGYVNTQEVIDLIKELQRGNIPDAVIFYDGVNDVYSAYQNKQAGLPQNEANRRREFNATRNLHVAYENFVYTLAQRSKLVSYLARITSSGRHDIPDDANLDDLALEVVAAYFNNVKIVKALSHEFGFEVAFYWQPTVFKKGELTDYEQSERAREMLVEPLFKQVYGTISATNNKNGFYDISELFSETKAPVFIDFCHISEEGNSLVAKAMVDTFINKISTVH